MWCTISSLPSFDPPPAQGSIKPNKIQLVSGSFEMFTQQSTMYMMELFITMNVNEEKIWKEMERTISNTAKEEWSFNIPKMSNSMSSNSLSSMEMMVDVDDDMTRVKMSRWVRSSMTCIERRLFTSCCVLTG